MRPARPDLVEAQRPQERVLADELQRRGPADQEAGLRPAQELVAGEGAEVGAGLDPLGHRRLRRQAVGRGRQERAGAEVVHQPEVAPARQAGQLLQRRLGDEALELEVGAVDHQERAGARRDGLLEVAQVGPVGGPDLDEGRAGAAQDVGDAEAAADLDELAARDDHLRGCAADCGTSGGPSRGEGSAAAAPAPTSDGRAWESAARASSTAEASLLTETAPSAPVSRQSAASAWWYRSPRSPALEVVLEVAVALGRRRHGPGRGGGERRPAQVGVDHHAGGVDHPPERAGGRRRRAVPGARPRSPRRAGRAPPPGRAGGEGRARPGPPPGPARAPAGTRTPHRSADRQEVIGAGELPGLRGGVGGGHAPSYHARPGPRDSWTRRVRITARGLGNGGEDRCLIRSRKVILRPTLCLSPTLLRPRRFSGPSSSSP